MLGLSLRAEFRGPEMRGTAISLRTSDNQGAVQKPAEHILPITYPTADIQTALRAISTKRSGRPIVVMGDRGRGKSHILAVMHHAIESPAVVEQWIHGWADRLASDEMRGIQIVKGFKAISEPVHNHEYPQLWDLLFDRHSKGQYYRGQFEQMAQPFPPRTLLEKMFQDQPTCLILDEFQTWFTGLPEEDPKTGLRLRQWASNFVQILSEIARDCPENLIFVISVFDNQNEAFRQVHRQSPVLIDFRGPTSKKDRQRLLLHRLFENRANIPDNEIATISEPYANERFRLLYADRSEAERDRIAQEVVECWPFSPELLRLLEDQILLSQAAQETRDLIRILAHAYRGRGESVPIITPADFFVDGESEEVQSLIDAIASQVGQEKLREVARRNLESLLNTGLAMPHARELVSSIWMHSMSPAKRAGATPSELHLDITRKQPVDDNAFQAEITHVIENSINIHGDDVLGGPLWFALEENPRSKVRACAKNDKLWRGTGEAVAGQAVYPGKDIEHIRRTLKHVLVSETHEPPSRVIVLGPHWESDPWSEVEDVDKPACWQQPVLLVIPEKVESGTLTLHARLGQWLAKQVTSRRNSVRFLLLGLDSPGLFDDAGLMYLARCSYLCSREAWGTDGVYRTLHQEFDRPLRTALKTRFTRFAILRKWDYQQPHNCEFDVATFSDEGNGIPSAIEDRVARDFFDQDVFRSFVIERAGDSEFIGAVMDDLIEPPPPGSGDVLPFLGETRMFEKVLEIAAEGKIALNVGGTWITRRPEDTDSKSALQHIKSKAFRTGQEMRSIQLGLPGAVGGAAVPGAVGVPQIPSAKAVPGDVHDPKAKNGGAQYLTGCGSHTPISQESRDETDAHANDPKAAVIAKTRRTDKPATGLNLSGCLETWGVHASQVIETARVEFTGLTVQQIRQVLQRIPSAYLANLEITWKDGGEK
ncbi:MAG: hypothetical protein HPY55_01285 [Firmicutes bacterium]|nr:hypothetical protein [Bacillota bacterium]